MPKGGHKKPVRIVTNFIYTHLQLCSLYLSPARELTVSHSHCPVGPANELLNCLVTIGVRGPITCLCTGALSTLATPLVYRLSRNKLRSEIR